MMENIVLKIAKQSIYDSLYYECNLDKDLILKKHQWLANDGASFVTLTYNSQLRGCIGSLIAQQPLIEDIIANSNNAAFKDSRFFKLTREEFKDITIEISILSTPTLVRYTNLEDLKTKITPLVDGIILQHEGKQATFLPQVWKELPEFETFFEQLLHKATLPIDCFKKFPKIYKYQVKKY